MGRERGERAGASPEGEWASSRAPFKSGSHVQIKFRLLSRPLSPRYWPRGKQGSTLLG